MSTEHASGHDHEYGPTPPGAQYEHTDIDPSIGYKFALWLAVAMLISFAIVYGTFRFFDSRQDAADQRSQRYPLAAGVTRENPTPFLQTQPFKDIYMLREEEARKMQGYGWVDKDGGVTRIPIERAMELMIQRGFATQPQAGAALDVVTQDSSSGRTVVPR
jgi:hypothetical protein